VTAFYLQIWFQDDFRNFWDACPWEEDLSYCRQVRATQPSKGFHSS
jgi:tRNA-5-taurinomethyluridine 2-sulfurtransferase